MAKGALGLTARSKAVDPTLAALFSTSTGPVVPSKSRYVDLLPSKDRSAKEAPEEEAEDDEDEDEDEEDDEDASDEDTEDDEEEVEEVEEAVDEDGDDEELSEGSDVDEEADVAELLEAFAERTKGEKVVPTKSETEEPRKRKRRQRDDDEDLETNYLAKLADDEDDEPSGKRLKADKEKAAKGEDAGDSDSPAEGEDVIMHESLTAKTAESELEKANRTVFLSNVSTEAITDRKSKKTLMRYLSSILDKDASPPQKVDSIRFRSTAFSTAGIPKRAAYIKKEVLEATTKSTNAYVVYSTPAAARAACTRLNGTIVLDRHIRVDSVAHPSPVDHRRCVFVGNLGFVDDESVLNTVTNEEGKEVTEKKKRTKVPMDVEEGLWRVFGKEGGKVESVRVVRDPVTRVGKGFAYVQFYDGNSVESALLLSGKKFPPMLPRELRVNRCKAPHKTARAMEAKMGKSDPKDRRGRGKERNANGYVPKPTAEAQTLAGRAGRLLGRAGAQQLSGADRKKEKKEIGRANREAKRHAREGGDGENAGEKQGGFRSPEEVVLEGRRASAKDGKPKDLKFKGARSSKKRVFKKGSAGKPTGRGAVRAAKWKTSGGKK
ncbi:nucleolar protein 12 [Diplogelasinospora grovesii]|uniref:Nucleolar protein 12 n=1 Tax=Diplogelasinospora grovesii TaxID=303347 RepID=A0AAN6RZV3_9PEZI|nr:nucleolar protein 12 [Diplogelasinospora grovesii]